MKNYTFLILIIGSILFVSCKATKTINKAISSKQEVLIKTKLIEDSINNVRENINEFKSHYIDFSTFSAKIKVESAGAAGKNPDITAVVRIIKDSVIWMSLSATFLNVEVYRVLITKDSVILINKQDKEVTLRSLDYLQEVTQIPFDFNTLQNVIIGNPIFIGDSINSFNKKDNLMFFSTADDFFKNLLTITSNDKLLVRSKMDDIDVNRSRTADIIYDGYVNSNGKYFSTGRHISISEKNKLDIKLDFKQYDFNNNVSVLFNVPKSYKRK